MRGFGDVSCVHLGIENSLNKTLNTFNGVLFLLLRYVVVIFHEKK